MFANLADLHFNTVHANDVSFFDEIDEIIQEAKDAGADVRERIRRDQDGATVWHRFRR